MFDVVFGAMLVVCLFTLANADFDEHARSSALERRRRA